MKNEKDIPNNAVHVFGSWYKVETKSFLKTTSVEVIEEDALVTAYGSNKTQYRFDPNDPLRSWAIEYMELFSVFQKYGDLLDPSNTVIDIHDSGIELVRRSDKWVIEHQDLQNIKLGKNYTVLHGDSMEYVPKEVFVHGTEIAGIVGATANNKKGVFGISCGDVYAVRVLEDNGYGYVSTILIAANDRILWAVQNKKNLVINWSLGLKFDLMAWEELIRTAEQKADSAGIQIYFVCSSGNEGWNMSVFPAHYTNFGRISTNGYKSVISVGSLDSVGTVSYWSNFGSVDAFAPGNKVLTTWCGSRYHRVDGTSYAAPQVAGIVALMIMTGKNIDIKNIIRENGNIALDKDGGSQNAVSLPKIFEAIFPERGSFQKPSVELNQNYPNPFNVSTTIEYVISRPGRTTVILYNTLGQKVRTFFDAYQYPGRHFITWDGRNDDGHAVSSGIYIYRLQSEHMKPVSKKLTIVK